MTTGWDLSLAAHYTNFVRSPLFQLLQKENPIKCKISLECCCPYKKCGITTLGKKRKEFLYARKYVFSAAASNGANWLTPERIFWFLESGIRSQSFGGRRERKIKSRRSSSFSTNWNLVKTCKWFSGCWKIIALYKKREERSLKISDKRNQELIWSRVINLAIYRSLRRAQIFLKTKWGVIVFFSLAKIIVPDSVCLFSVRMHRF